MNKTAQQIYDDFHGQLVAITKTNGERWLGFIMLTAGLQKAETLIPNTTFIAVDVISDLEIFTKGGVNYAYEHKIIHPDDIANIGPYDGISV